MQSNTTTGNTGGASAADDIASALDKAEDLAIAIGDASCVAKILEERLADAIFPGISHSDNPGFYYLGDDDRKILGFASHEAVSRAEAMNDLADELVDALNGLRKQMKANETTKAGRYDMNSGLEGAIRTWRVAFTELVESGKGGEGTNDTPEAAAEEKALAEMAAYPCLTLGEIRRKASLFIDDSYLKEAPRSLQNAVMRSFSDVAIFDAKKMQPSGAGA